MEIASDEPTYNEDIFPEPKLQNFHQAYQKLTQHSITNDMNKQGFVPPAQRLAAPGVNSQQNMFPQQPQNIRTQTNNYFPNATTQNVPNPRAYPSIPSPRTTIPIMYGIHSANASQAYTSPAGTQVIMNPNQVIPYPSTGQRISTPPFPNQQQQSVQQFQMAAAANQQFYPQTTPTASPMFYSQPQSFPVSQPRPPSGTPVQNSPSYHQRRTRSLIKIVDPNTGKDISEEILNSRPAADGSLGSGSISSDMRAQFAAQVAATLKPVMQNQMQRDTLCMSYPVSTMPLQQVVPPVQTPVQQMPQQIQSHQTVAQPPQTPQTQVHQLTAVQQQSAQQPGISPAPIPHIPQRPVTPQPQPQRRQPSKSPPQQMAPPTAVREPSHGIGISSISSPVQKLPDTGCIGYTPRTPQSQELIATQSHTAPPTRPLSPSTQQLPPVQKQSSQIATMSPPTQITSKNSQQVTSLQASQSSSQQATLEVTQASQQQTPQQSPHQALMQTQQQQVQQVSQQQPSQQAVQQTAPPLQSVKPALSLQPSQQALKRVPQVLQTGSQQTSQPSHSVLQPQPQQASLQTLQTQPLQQTSHQGSQPVLQSQPSPEAPPEASMQQTSQEETQQTSPAQALQPQVPQLPQRASTPPEQTLQHEPSKEALLQQEPTRDVIQQALKPKPLQETSEEAPLPLHLTQQATQPSLPKQVSPPVETTESSHKENIPIMYSKLSTENNINDLKGQSTLDIPNESSSILSTDLIEKSTEVNVERTSLTNIEPENETGSKTVIDEKDAARVPSPLLENSKLTEEYPTTDLKKDKSKKKEETLKKGKIEETETDEPVESELSDTEDITEETNKPAKVMEVKDEKAVEEEEKITKVEIKIEDEIVANENEKNEAKNNEEEITDENEDTILRYRYKEDQWSPLNPEGKKQYDRDFLLELQYSNESLSKPVGLPDLPDVILTKPYQPEITRTFEKTGVSGSYESRFDFTPGYVKSSKGPGSGSGITKRGSQQSGNRKEIKKIMGIQITELPLKRCENAWKPNSKITKACEDEDEDDINKKIRSILNKLTPQKFNVLLAQIRDIQIDTENKLKLVIDLLFEKAISEPSFSVAYANLCRYLTLLRVPSATKPGENVNFRAVLLTRCQKEFEKDTVEEAELSKKKQQIENADSEERKKILQQELNEEFSAAKRRSIGNIRFIGELFKLKMLTETIMHECVFKLLRSKDEENLECLCRLLKTIGKELDSEVAKPRMDQYFQQMRKIVSERKTSSRVRFMLQDVMELRECKWVPRRAENNPKTIEQIHAEAAQEEKDKKILLESTAAMQRSFHHRSGGNGGNNAGGGNRGGQGQRGSSMSGAVGGDDGWNTVMPKVKIDVNKFRLPRQKIDNEIQLGPGGGNLSGWGRGSSGGLKGSQESERPAPGNRFSALSRPEEDGRGRVYGRGGVSPARGDVMARSLQSSTSSSNSRSKMPSRSSQESDKDKERVLGSSRNVHNRSGRATPPSRGPSRESSRSRDVRPSKEVVEPSVPATKDLTKEELQKKTIAIMDEYLHLEDIKEAALCISEIKSHPDIHLFIYYALNHVLERSEISRRQTGRLLAKLVKQEVLEVEIYMKGLMEVLEYAEDMEIDIPKIWQYFGELIGPMIQDGSIPTSFLKTVCEPIRASNLSGALVAEILKEVNKELGQAKVGELWRSSGLQWSDFIDDKDTQSFIKEKKLEFTLGDSTSQPNTDKMSMTAIQGKLNTLLLTKNVEKYEEIVDWINANVSEEERKQSQLIRALMTAVCSSSISGQDAKACVEEEHLKHSCLILKHYLGHQVDLQLQALYALQVLDHKLEHPPSVLKNFFAVLFEEEVISREAFFMWKKSNDPAEQEGKGVALKQVAPFLTFLEEEDS